MEDSGFKYALLYTPSSSKYSRCGFEIPQCADLCAHLTNMFD
jgi:hypothetical protein